MQCSWVRDGGRERPCDSACARMSPPYQRTRCCHEKRPVGIRAHASARAVQRSRFGVIGMGSIGSAVARKAAGLGFEVVCWSRSLLAGSRSRGGHRVVELDELAQDLRRHKSPHRINGRDEVSCGRAAYISYASRDRDREYVAWCRRRHCRARQGLLRRGGCGERE